MQVSRKGLAELASHEGVVPMPYKDSVGVWTFGVGHTRYAGDPNPANLPKGVAQKLSYVFEVFARDVQKYANDVSRALKVPVEQHEFDALVSFHYNTGAIARASLMTKLNAGDRAGAARAFMYWTKPKEITARRQKEMELFKYGRYGN
ncbi:MAG: lysozyme, partial [Candidatus Saccharibacteria bacterium]|nr:lysozyme [Candidatus Saccharibacteria bacterium]